MGIERFFVQNVTIIRPGSTVDVYNNTLPDWDDTTETDAAGWLHQLTAVEVLDNRDARITGWVLYLPAGTDIVATDRCDIDGDLFEVDGPPLKAHTPAGQHHLECALKVVTG